jgi:hypothetical protein
MGAYDAPPTTRRFVQMYDVIGLASPLCYFPIRFDKVCLSESNGIVGLHIEFSVDTRLGIRLGWLTSTHRVTDSSLRP